MPIETTAWGAQDHLATAGEQIVHLNAAFESLDMFMIVQALKDVGAVRHISIVLDENPPLGEVLRAIKALELTVSISTK